MSLVRGTKRAALLAAALMATWGPVAAKDSAAHIIADKFAGDDAGHSDEARRKADEQRKRDAERKAQEALRDQARKRAEEALRADRERERQRLHPETASKPAPTAPASQPSDKTEASAKPAELLAAERDMLARARREDELRRVAEERAASEAEARRKIEEAEAAKREIEKIITGAEAGPQVAKTAAPETAAPSTAPAREPEKAQLAQPPASPPTASPADAAARRALIAKARTLLIKSAQRLEARAKADAEAKAIAAATPPAVQAPAVQAPVVQAPAPTAASTEQAVLTPTQPVQAKAPPLTPPAFVPASGPAVTPASAPAKPGLEPRVTILISMQPGNKGIRRHNKLADPVLCLNEGCYVSAGAAAPARYMPGRTALGIGNTMGGRAGACRNRLTCVFRSIAVEEVPLIVQPVDMRMVKHDRRRIQAIAAHSQCRIVGDSVTCAKAIVADDYVMWVLPETLANSAGPTALERALSDGLETSRSAALTEARH